MTEQPAEPTTEQTWLGNPQPVAYLHDGHRIPARPAGEMAPKERSGLATKFLGAIDSAFDKADNDLKGRRATDAGLRRLDADIEAARTENRRTPLDHQAELHAGNAVQSLSNGELDAGIAWLQSALAFAQNHRHTTRHEGTNQ